MIPTNQPDRGFPIAGRECLLDSLDRARRILESQARLVEQEVMDVVRPGGAAHGAIRAVGMAPERHWLAGAIPDRVHDCRHVLELPLDGVARGVAARAKASAVHREGGHAVPEFRHQRVEPGVVAQRAMHEDERRPFAGDPDGDRGPIRRSDIDATRLALRSAHRRIVNRASVSAHMRAALASDEARKHGVPMIWLLLRGNAVADARPEAKGRLRARSSPGPWSSLLI